jgi:hypothetical protein
MDRSRCNFSRQLRVVIEFQQRISSVASGSIDVGSEHPTRKPGQTPAGISPPAGLHSEPPGPLALPRIPVAMAQQCGGSGHQSAPQKLLHLVGWRDAKARPTPWVRPGPPPAKP